MRCAHGAPIEGIGPAHFVCMDCPRLANIYFTHFHWLRGFMPAAICFMSASFSRGT